MPAPGLPRAISHGHRSFPPAQVTILHFHLRIHFHRAGITCVHYARIARHLGRDTPASKRSKIMQLFAHAQTLEVQHV